MRARFFSLLLFAGLSVAAPARAEDVAARGAYLAILGDCAGCHTAPHQPGFSGGLPFTAQFGTVYSTNITPDRQTGIGGWTEDQFYRALHQGVAADGHRLYPAFPYLYFTRVSRTDSDALFAYLKGLAPVHRPPTPNRLIFPFNIRALMIFWNWLYLDDQPFAADPRKSPAENRGAYLVTGLGHCAACHTPKDLLFGDESAQGLTGGLVDNWFAANLTGTRQDGLGKWSESDVTRYLATGSNSHATAVGSMLEKVTLSTSKMTADDRTAIASYLKGLAPRRPLRFEAPQLEQMGRGEGVFAARCATCHTPPGAGGKYPQLAGDTLVAGHDPTTVMRVILEGGSLPPAAAAPDTHAMPGFAALGDGDIADVATYIRNEWGNSAPAVTAYQVMTLRRGIAATPGG